MLPVTIVIPVSPYHTEIAQEAFESAKAQTVPCKIVTIYDTEGRGAGWARNRGAEQADTPFVAFFDADDLVNPNFVALTLNSYRPGFYVYTDYTRADGSVVTLPGCEPMNLWERGMFHLSHALVPTVYHRRVGGFDETLPVMEDNDYFLKLQSEGICGLRCPHALVTYRYDEGRRAKTLVTDGVLNDRYAEINAILNTRYARTLGMPCSCNDNAPTLPASINEARPGDILVEAMYAPMTQVGRVTQTLYPRAGHGQRIYVNAQDADRSPEWWRPVPDMAQIAPDVESVMALAREAVMSSMLDEPPTVYMDEKPKREKPKRKRR